jgi:hypothetical protein
VLEVVTTKKGGKKGKGGKRSGRKATVMGLDSDGIDASVLDTSRRGTSKKTQASNKGKAEPMNVDSGATLAKSSSSIFPESFMEDYQDLDIEALQAELEEEKKKAAQIARESERETKEHLRKHLQQREFEQHRTAFTAMMGLSDDGPEDMLSFIVNAPKRRKYVPVAYGSIPPDELVYSSLSPLIPPCLRRIIHKLLVKYAHNGLL